MTKSIASLASGQVPLSARHSTTTRLDRTGAIHGALPSLFERLRISERTTFAGFQRELKKWFGVRFDEQWEAWLHSGLREDMP